MPEPSSTCQVQPADAPERRARTRRLLGLRERDIVLVAPQPMTRGGGHKLAIWVHAILHQLVDNVRLLMPLDGPVRERVDYFRRTGGYAEEILMPRSDVSLEDALCAADIAVFLGDDEQTLQFMPLAMAQGLPVVAMETPQARELLGADAPLAPAAPRALARVLLELIDDPARAKALGQKMRERAPKP